jgi:aryl-alcohol dehydrogenase-like predicted oxidoreductase
MRTRVLGPSGIEASVVAFGAWAIGGWMWGGADEEDGVRAIQASLDAGVNFIDTAPAYGLGRSEELVARAVERRRDKAVISTKCGLAWHTSRGTFFFNQGGKPVHRYLGADSIVYECEQSLKRLRTDYIDLYQTHWQDATTPIEETMSALLKLKQQGKIRAIGVSNANLEQIAGYLKFGPVDSDQEKYSILDREHEATLLPFCREMDIAVLAYSPLANGLLTGKIGPDRVFPPGDLRHNNPRFSVENRARIAAQLDRVRPIADSYGVTLTQLMVAWTLAQPGVTHALVGARDAKQAQENAAAGDVMLSTDEIAAIHHAFKQPVGRGAA